MTAAAFSEAVVAADVVLAVVFAVDVVVTVVAADLNDSKIEASLAASSVVQSPDPWDSCLDSSSFAAVSENALVFRHQSE